MRLNIGVWPHALHRRPPGSTVANAEHRGQTCPRMPVTASWASRDQTVRASVSNAEKCRRLRCFWLFSASGVSRAFALRPAKDAGGEGV